MPQPDFNHRAPEQNYFAFGPYLIQPLCLAIHHFYTLIQHSSFLSHISHGSLYTLLFQDV